MAQWRARTQKLQHADKFPMHMKYSYLWSSATIMLPFSILSSHMCSTNRTSYKKSQFRPNLNRSILCILLAYRSGVTVALLFYCIYILLLFRFGWTLSKRIGRLLVFIKRNTLEFFGDSVQWVCVCDVWSCLRPCMCLNAICRLSAI